MRWFFLIFILFSILWVGVWGWQGQKSSNNPIEVFQDMDHQYKLRAQKSSDLFADGRAARKPVEGTLPIGYTLPDKPLSKGGKPDLSLALDDSYYATGLFGDFYGEGYPEEVTLDESLLKRGQRQYDIYCSMCHGHSGDGIGVVAKHWPGGILPPTANLIDGRVAELPEGRIFQVITHGNGGLMGPYGGNIAVPDRWAIVAYLDALQLSQNADLKNADVKKAYDAALQAQQAETE